MLYEKWNNTSKFSENFKIANNFCNYSIFRHKNEHLTSLNTYHFALYCNEQMLSCLQDSVAVDYPLIFLVAHITVGSYSSKHNDRFFVASSFWLAT